MEKKNKKDKVLHTCDGKLNVYDYQELFLNFKIFYWNSVLSGTITFIIPIILYGLVTSLIDAISLFIIIEIFILIIFKMKAKTIGKNQYKSLIKKDPNRFEYETELYKDYLIRRSQNKTLKINYSDIERIVETDSNFYLKTKKMIITIQKSSCELDTITFIRNINKAILENRLGNDKTIKKFTIKNQNPKKDKLLNILFLVSNISFAFAWIVLAIAHDHFTLDAFLVYVIVMPIPIITSILSLILGIVYSRKGYDCIKNIVSSICVLFLSFCLGILTIMASSDYDYEVIYDYQSVLGIELPDDGMLTKEEYNYGNITNGEQITVYFVTDNLDQIEKEIKNNPNWIAGDKLDYSLKRLIPVSQIDLDNVYYSIYIEEIDKYNELPTETGKYHIYAMMFYKDLNYIEILDYIYEYKG